MRETKTIDLYTPPPMAVQPEIEIVDPITLSTMDLSTPKTMTIGQSTSIDEQRNSTDNSPVQLSPR